VADTIYNRWKYRNVTGTDIVGSADFRMLLLETTAAGAFNPDLDTVADLLAVGSVAEMIATNYARQALTGETAGAGPDDTNDRVNIDFTDLVFASLGIAAGTDGSVVAAVTYVEGASDAARFLVSYHDSGFPVVTNGQSLTVATPNDWMRLT
jgi:hypothetical protein